MAKQSSDKDLLNWLNQNPQLKEKLQRIHQLEQSDPDIDFAELDLLETTRSIGQLSFKRILQDKSDALTKDAVAEKDTRKQGKKN